MKPILFLISILIFSGQIIAGDNLPVNEQTVNDTTFRESNRAVLFHRGYRKHIKRTYVNGRLRKKTVSVICVSCTYVYTVKSRTVEYLR